MKTLILGFLICLTVSVFGQKVPVTLLGKYPTKTEVNNALDAYQDSLNARPTNAQLEAASESAYSNTEIDNLIGAIAQDNFFVNGLSLCGSTIKASVIASYASQGTLNTSLTDGTRYYQRIYVDKETTLTGVAYTLNTQGAFTGDNVNGIALYSGTGATMTRVAITANDANIWKTNANTAATIAFTSPYVAAKGVYTLVLLYNTSTATTTPVIYSGGAWSANVLDMFGFTSGSGKFIYGTQAGQTDLPATITSSGVTPTGAPLTIFVY